MLTRFLNHLSNNDAEVHTLADKIRAAYDIADPAEKLLRFDSLEEESHKALQKAEKPALWGGGSVIALGVAIEASAFVLGPEFLLAGIPVGLAGVYLKDNIAKDARDALKACESRSHNGANYAVETLTQQDLEKSPCRDAVLAKHPELREKFSMFAGDVREQPAPAAVTVPGAASAPPARRTPGRGLSA